MFSYNPDTGLFTRRIDTERCEAGEVLRPPHPDVYFSIDVDGETYAAHRLVWKYVTGDEPNVVDHINGVRSDNRIENLRDVNNTQNAWNRTRRTTVESGFVGVARASGGTKWKAQIKTADGLISIGPFNTPDAASAARDQLLPLYRGEYHRGPT